MPRFKIIEAKEQKPITLYSDPSYQGADVDLDDPRISNLPVKELEISKIIPFEKEKLKTDQFRSNVRSMYSSIKNGKWDDVPPVLVRKIGLISIKYQLIDGHHRVETYKLLGKTTIPAKIVPNSLINQRQLPEKYFDSDGNLQASEKE